jgi:hypothetical protein
MGISPVDNKLRRPNLKPPKFLFCESIIGKGDNSTRAFILHTRDPLVFAEVLHFETDDEGGQMLAKSNTQAYASLDYDDEYILLIALWIVPGDKHIKKPAQEQADDLAGIMRRMADWYKALLIYEDNLPDFIDY